MIKKNDVKFARFKYSKKKVKGKTQYVYDTHYDKLIPFEDLGKVLFTSKPKLGLDETGYCYIMNKMGDNANDEYLASRAKKVNMEFPAIVYLDFDMKTDKIMEQFVKDSGGSPEELMDKLADDNDVWIHGHSGGGVGVRVLFIVYNKNSDEYLKDKTGTNDEKYREVYNSNYRYVLDMLEEKYGLKYYNNREIDYFDRAPISNMVLKTHECLLDEYTTVKEKPNVLFHHTKIIDKVVEDVVKKNKESGGSVIEVMEDYDDISFVPNSEFMSYDFYIIACAVNSNQNVRKQFYNKYVDNYRDGGGFNYLDSFEEFDNHLDSIQTDFATDLRIKFFTEYINMFGGKMLNDALDNAIEIKELPNDLNKDLEINFREKLSELIDEENELEAQSLKYKLIDKDEKTPKLIKENKIRISKQRQLINDRRKLKTDYKIELDKNDKNENELNIKRQVEQTMVDDDRREMLILSLQKYIQVGDNYFEISYDKYNNKEYEPRKYENIKRKHRLKNFEPDDFIKAYYSKATVVDNINYKKDVRIGGNLRLNEYNEMPFKAKNGEWKHIKIMLEHLFGDKLEFILDYFKLLYLQPLQKLPIIALASKEGDTGKSTFLHFVNNMFGKNSVQIGSNQLKSNFNHIYANKLVAIVDETYIDKKDVQEQIKSYVTQQEIVVTEKHVSDRSVEFFTKFIMGSNNVDFTSASETETRYAVFNPTKPKFKIVDIDVKMKNEIPAFLNYLLHRVYVYNNESRLYFDEKVYETTEVIELKKNSRTNVVKDLIIYFDEFLSEFNLNSITFTLSELMEYFKIQGNISHIRRKLNNEFNLKVDKSNKEYTPLKTYFTNYGSNIKKQNTYTITRTLINELL